MVLISRTAVTARLPLQEFRVIQPTFNGTSVDLTVNGTAYKLSYDSGVLTMVLNYDNNRIEFSFTKQR